jgi:hypothetical protein
MRKIRGGGNYASKYGIYSTYSQKSAFLEAISSNAT